MVRSKGPHGQRAVAENTGLFPVGTVVSWPQADRDSEMGPAWSACRPGHRHMHISLWSSLPGPLCPSWPLGLPGLLQDAFPMSPLLHALSSHTPEPPGLTTSEYVHPPFFVFLIELLRVCLS